MGCSNQKNVEVKDDQKEEGKINEDEDALNNLQNMNVEEAKEEENQQLEEMSLEKANVDLNQNHDQEEPKEQENNFEFGVEKENEEEEKKEEEEEKKEEENVNNEEDKHNNQEEDIQEDIDINQDDNLEEYNDFEINNKSGTTNKKNEESNASANNLRSKNISKGKGNKSRNKNNKNKPKKKPFIISEIQSSPYKKVKILVNACSFTEEYMMPIWCPKDVYIKFRVEGKWRIDKQYDYTDSKGMPSSHSAGFNYGALVGRIGLGKKFMVTDEGAILSEKEGPLFLRQNLPKKMQLEPEGKLEVTVYDGEYKEIEEINNLIGWKENGSIEHNNNGNNKERNNTNKKKSNNDLEKENKDLEKKLRNYFNNLRMNPSMFYEKYISFNQSLIWTKKYLDKTQGQDKNPLAENETSYNFIADYFNSPNQKEILKTVNKNNLAQYLLKMDEDIGYFLYDQVGMPVKVKSKITQRDIPNEIIIQFLLDKKYRDFIFNEKSQYLTIKIFKNFFNKSTLVVVAIFMEKENSQDDIDYN